MTRQTDDSDPNSQSDIHAENLRVAEAWLLDLVRDGVLAHIEHYTDAQGTLYFNAYMDHSRWTAADQMEITAHVMSFEERFELRFTLHLREAQANPSS